MSSEATGKPEMIRVENISKRFGGVDALRNVSVTIARGEIHALVGENGAGKSTLMKIMAGIYQPDSGQIFLRGEPVSLNSPLQARQAGVSIVSQELALFPHLSITANIFANREESTAGVLNKRKMSEEARQVLTDMGVYLDPSRTVSSLAVGERQLVEIARTFHQQSDIIIMDEPNSALNAYESERLFEILRGLRDRGLTIIYVSHRLEEVAAHYAGIRVNRYRIMVMALMGFIVGIAAVMLLAFQRGGNPASGPGQELYVIAATIIGGTALTGGSGSVIGAVVGAIIVWLIQNGLVLLGIDTAWATVSTGSVIILAVALDYLIKRRPT